MDSDSDAREVLAALQRQRSAVVNAALWVSLAIGLITFVVNAVLLGSAIFTPRALLPNVLLIGTVLVSMWLNRRGRMLAATLLTAGLLLTAAAIPVLAIGIDGNGAVLLLFFLPLVMAGLLLDRLGLAVIAGVSMAVVLAAAFIHAAPAAAGAAEIVGGNALMVALQFNLVFATLAFLLDRFGYRYQATLKALLSERIRAEHELRKEKEFSDAVVESLPGLFYVRDATGSLIRWNAEFQRVTGYSDEEIGELPPLAMFESGDKPAVASRLETVLERGHDSAIVRVLAKDGSTTPYFLSGTRAALGGDEYIVCVGIDRSEIDSAHARIETLNEELARRLERLVALREIDMAIIGSLDLDLTLSVVLDQVRGRLGVPAARILLHDQVDKTLRFGAGQGFGSIRPRSLRLRLGEGPAGQAALERETVTLDGQAALADVVEPGAAAGETPFHGYMAVPLVAKGRLQGVLELFDTASLPTQDDWHDFLDALSVQAAIALDSSSLFEGLERSNIELRQAYDMTIESLSRALDLKDEETEGHSRRVTELSVQLAARFGLTGDQLVQVRRGSLLHDIGKMGVPDAILLKPGKLDADEWQIMRQHTTFANQLLSSIPFLRPALDIPYAHHERWDGEGYPRGLKGEQIPLTARLFAVVDVYDALISDRPYRRAWTAERALAHIRAGAGSHFDPKIADEFLDMISERQTSTD